MVIELRAAITTAQLHTINKRRTRIAITFVI